MSRGNYIFASGIATPPSLSSHHSNRTRNNNNSSNNPSPRNSHLLHNSTLQSPSPRTLTINAAAATATTPTRPNQSSQSNLTLPSQMSQSNDRARETLEDWAIADFVGLIDEDSQHTLADGDEGGFLTGWGEYVPSVSMPEMPSVNMRDMSMSLPDMPSVSMPSVTMPEMTMPSYEMNMGEYVPSLPSVPGINTTITSPSCRIIVFQTLVKPCNR